MTPSPLKGHSVGLENNQAPKGPGRALQGQQGQIREGFPEVVALHLLI